MTELLKSIDPELFADIQPLGTPEEPFYLVKQLCTVLGYTSTHNVLRNTPDKYKDCVFINNHKTNVVNTDGLYWIIMRCNKPSSLKVKERLIARLSSLS